MKLTSSDAALIAHCVQEAESRTQAEIVFVYRRTSGNYRDLSYLFGLACSFSFLAFQVYSPFDFDETLFPVNFLIIFALSSWLYLSQGWVRYLSRKKRRHDQVLKSARACFVEKGISKTSRHTGILIYYSDVENQAVILSDESAGSGGRLVAAKLAEFETTLSVACRARAHAAKVQAITEFLRSFGIYLSRTLPCDHHSSNELCNSPDLESEDTL